MKERDEISRKTMLRKRNILIWLTAVIFCFVGVAPANADDQAEWLDIHTLQGVYHARY